ncbi:MAG: hypothetical protein IKL40_03875, partial [Clostridia bacterium]|nr:hypothetical protein [Clostridia bacterium]
MAERRMFAKSIVDSDAFLELPSTAQALYFHLCLEADDDGFSNTPQKTKRILGASDSDLRLLENGGFIISFDSGVVVVRHWKVHNRVRKDSYKRTLYLKEFEMLSESSEGVYEVKVKRNKNNENQVSVTESQQNVTESQQNVTQDRIGKDRKVKDSIGEDRTGEWSSPAAPKKATEKKSMTFSTDTFPPTFETVEQFCRERGNKIDAKRFYSFYTERDWKINGQTMADWKACIRGWEKTEYRRPPPHNEADNKDRSFEVGEFFDAAINRSYR